LGHVTLAWNDCHSMVLDIFHTLSGLSWGKAQAVFLALKSDHDRREITLVLMAEVLNTENDQPLREQGTKLLGQLAGLAGERNLATHTMWITVMPQREVRPHPALRRPKNLKADFKSQFTSLTTKLRGLFRDLLRHHAALRVHLSSVTNDPRRFIAGLLALGSHRLRPAVLAKAGANGNRAKAQVAALRRSNDPMQGAGAARRGR
jgi:hypothetical protein